MASSRVENILPTDVLASLTIFMAYGHQTSAKQQVSLQTAIETAA